HALERTNRLEYVSSNEGAGGWPHGARAREQPEDGLRIRIPVLVTDDLRCRRGRQLIRSERHPPSGVELRELPLELARTPTVVVFEERDVLAPRQFYADVA